MRGFTLIELAATLAVTAILIGLGMPAMTDSLRDRRTAGAAESIAAILRGAQIEAIKRHRTVIVAFQDGADGAWCLGVSITTACNCASQPQDCRVDGASRIVRGTEYPGVSLAASSDFHFKSLRNTVNDGNVRLTGAHGRELRVVVSGSVGRIRFCSPAGTASLAGYPSC